MNKKLVSIIDQLKELIKSNPDKYVFFEPANQERIAAFEQQHGFFLPESYKFFLSHFNGGFINNCGFVIDITTQSKLYAGWGYNQFFSIEDIAGEYTTFLDEDELSKDYTPRFKEFIPFMMTEDNEKVAFKALPHKGEEADIYDCFHEVKPEEWKMLNNNFTSLLADYLKKDGEVSVFDYLNNNKKI